MERINWAVNVRGRQSGLEEESSPIQRPLSPIQRPLSPIQRPLTENDCPWVTDLINERETPIPTNAPPVVFFSDSFACSNTCAIHCAPYNIQRQEEFRQYRSVRPPVWRSDEFFHYNAPRRYILEENYFGLNIGSNFNGLHAGQGHASTSNAAREGSTSCPERTNVFQANNRAQSNSDPRQLPRRPRGLRFQCAHINEMEISFRMLQDVTWQLLNALGLEDRINLLRFENMIMQQRIDNMLHEELIRVLHENYLREIARLREVYEQQMQQQPSSSNSRSNSGRNLNSQSTANTSSMS